MRKFIGVGIGIGILLVILAVLFALAYNYLFPAPHEHYSTSEFPTVESLPNCTDDGLQYKVCAGCGEKYDAEILPALGHSLSDAVEENYISPDCVNDGSYDMVAYCTVCDYFKVETVTVDALGHTEDSVVKTENIVSPTCTENGSYDEVTYCTVCEAECSRNTVSVPANGHSDMAWELSRDENGDLVMTGEGSCGHNFEIYPDEENVTTRVIAPTCCPGTMIYTATVTVDGEKYSAELSEKIAPAFNHRINGVDFLEYSIGVDEFGKHYFGVSQELGIYKDEETEWGSDGCAEGYFKCSHCGGWISITVFDPDEIDAVE